MRDIAREAKGRPGLIDHYFNSKGEDTPRGCMAAAGQYPVAPYPEITRWYAALAALPA